MRFKNGFLGILLCSGILSAQQPLSGPVEGFTFDAPTASLRAVNGSLGSASLGLPLVSEIDYGSVAPHQNYAIVFRGGRCLIVSGLGAGQATATAVAGSFALPEGVAWSSDGSAAILYSRTGNWIQKLGGLPLSPTPGASLDLSLLGGSLSAVASDTSAERVAIGMSAGAAGGAAGGIYEMTGGQGFVPLLPLSQPIALAFSADGGTLYGIDGLTHQLSEVSMADSTSQTWALAPLQDPVAVRSATGGANSKIVYVAGASDRLLVAFDDSGAASSHQPIASIPLSFQPSVLEPLGTNSFVLRSRARTDDPLWSFTTSPQASVYFVPATPLPLREERRK